MAKKDETMEQREQGDACISHAESRVRKAAIKREQCQTCLSIAEREQARPKGKAADGHVMTKQVRAHFTQGGGLRRGCGRMEGHLGKMLQRKAVQIWPTTNYTN